MSSDPSSSTNTQTDTPNPDQSANQDQQETEALAAFTATLHSVGTNLETPLRDRAALITSNASALERQESELAGHTAALARQNAQWSGLADEAREGLKEIGDVQNWAEMIERELLVLEETVGEVERKQQTERGEGNEDEGGGGSDDGVNGSGDDGKKDTSKRGWLRWW